MIDVIVGVVEKEIRFDVFLADCPGVGSRSRAQQLIEAAKAIVDGRSRPKNYRLKPGETVSYEPLTEKPPTVEAEPIPLEIVFEDNDVVVVDKPAGLVVHPGAGNYSGTMVNALLAHTGLANIGSPLRPGIVHRLDKDTSGLIVAAKNDVAYMSLVRQLSSRKVNRQYLALVEGGFADNKGRIEAPIRRDAKARKRMTVGMSGAKEAVTNFKVLTSAGGYSLLEISLETGRTHQIRVHMKFINHPVVGDQVYGSSKSDKSLGLTRQWLHAVRLEFEHPSTGKRVVFTSEPPDELLKILNKKIKK